MNIKRALLVAAGVIGLGAAAYCYDCYTAKLKAKYAEFD